MKKLIVNADDFGNTTGVNQGIIYGFRNGIITSASLMVNRSKAEEAARLAKKNPGLGVGLHFEIMADDNSFILGMKPLRSWKGGVSFDVSASSLPASSSPMEGRGFRRGGIKKVLVNFQVEKAKKQFYNQIERFKDLMGKMPDHIDGHYHVHKLPGILPFIKEFSQKYQIPLRAVGNTNYIDHFSDYCHPENASIEKLVKILRGLPDGVSELMTHAGYSSEELRQTSSMSDCREVELQTLTSPEIKQVIKDEAICLISWREVKI